MQRAMERLTVAPARALVDGNRAPALACPAETIVDGDAKSMSIAAASIIAKVTRDRIMRALDGEHPGYNWAQNKGYATADHLAALDLLGPTAHHRRSFAPLAQMKLPFG
jgi:ribonuclease HII